MEKQRPRGYPEHRQRAALGRGGLGGRVVPTDRRSAESALELQFVYLSKVTALHLDITLI